MLSESQRAKYAERLRRGRADAAGRIERRPPGPAETPLSFGQEQLWFLDRFAPGLPTYNIPFLVRLTGPLDAAAFHRALDALVARHEALRTTFVTDAEGRPAQRIGAPYSVAAVPGDLEDLMHLDPERRAARLAEVSAAEAVRPFALAEGPLLRCRLLRLSPTEHAAVLVIHHIVFDGTSLPVFLGDLAALYGAETAGSGVASVLTELPVQFADYALWQRGRLEGPAFGELVDHWRGALAGFETLQLPTDRPRPPVDSFDGDVAALDLAPERWEGIRELARREGVTPNVVLMAALAVLLQRYSGQDDVVVGTFSANRGRQELQPLIGYLVNTLPIRVDLAGDPAFAEVLRRVREATVAAYGHQDLPFAKLVEALGIERDPSRAPVFQVAMTHAEAPESLTAGDVELRLEPIDLPAAKLDLTFLTQVLPGGGLRLEVAYTTVLFDRATALRILDHLAVLLDGAVADASVPLSRLPMLTDAELRQELETWNATATELPTGCVHEFFEAQAAQTPDGVAAECDGSSVTYAELNAQANRVARRLRGLGVGTGTLVGVGMAPSVRRLAALLGILKAGGGYVPLDPALPAERLSYMMQDAAMPVVVADEGAVAAVSQGSAKVVDLDAEWAGLAGLDTDDPAFAADPAEIAYVIYTSGSTGRPKGVVVEHRQVVNHALGMIRHWGFGPEDRVLQFASLNFDVSVMDMFSALLSGACAVVAPAETRLSPPRLADLLRERRVTVAGLPPAVAGLLSGYEFPDLRFLMVAGEAVSSELARAWLRPGLRLVNGYGPTEDTVIATMAVVDGSVMPPPIGLPVPNAQAYVLDAQLRPVPVGVVGELYMGGAGVARGYLNAPELTRERFIADPFAGVAGARLYKTGDLVRRLPDGNIAYLGRRDGQVKLRGLRIELGEIEAALLDQAGVAQAVVVIATDAADPAGSAGDKRLVGYVRPDDPSASMDVAELGLALARRLPAYMVPEHLVVLAEFPVNASGKIDRSALPAVAGAADGVDPALQPPRTLVELALVDMYAGLLGRDEVGADQGFFDLGGNSLRAMQLVTRLRDDLAVDVGVADIFVAPAPRQLAAILRDRHGVDDAELGEDGLDGLSEEETAAFLAGLD